MGAKGAVEIIFRKPIAGDPGKNSPPARKEYSEENFANPYRGREASAISTTSSCPTTPAAASSKRPPYPEEQEAQRTPGRSTTTFRCEDASYRLSLILLVESWGGQPCAKSCRGPGPQAALWLVGIFAMLAGAGGDYGPNWGAIVVGAVFVAAAIALGFSGCSASGLSDVWATPKWRSR